MQTHSPESQRQQDRFPGNLEKGDFEMVRSLTQNWWLVVLRGALSIAFGLAVFVWPRDALTALVILFGVYALVDGIFLVGSGIAGSGASGGMRWFLVLGGLAGIIVGIVTFFYPNITAL